MNIPIDITTELENLIISDTDYVQLSKLNNNGLLGYEFGRAIVVPANKVPRNVIRMNSRVVYLDESTGIKRDIKLVFPEDVDLNTGKISVLSPLGAALLGLKERQTFDWPTSNDPLKRLTIMRVTKMSYWENFMMSKALSSTKVFVGSYVFFMMLTYYLAQLGAQSPFLQGLDVAGASVYNFPFFLHLSAMLILLWICFVRGAIIGERWLVLLPMVVFAFELIPKLSTIPVVPTIYHLLAIVVGAACPIVSALDKSTT
ncbi:MULTISPECIES: GreA/GreB family elongation factor [Methylotenera]|uniref:GreA/GreB family elongation factor n=1 Tax=Methylotenera TaxID=359407 RepID=UPI0003A9A93C|nr:MULTISPECIES: GreA/GreB family elongation factor [Methylotenera]